MIDASNFTKCISLNDQACMARPTLVDLNLDEYNQGLHYYPFMVGLGRWNGSWNTLDDPFNKTRLFQPKQMYISVFLIW